MTEAVIIAVAEVIKATAELINSVVQGQTPEQREKMWNWYIADMERWRKFIGLDK